MLKTCFLRCLWRCLDLIEYNIRFTLWLCYLSSSQAYRSKLSLLNPGDIFLNMNCYCRRLCSVPAMLCVSEVISSVFCISRRLASARSTRPHFGYARRHWSKGPIYISLKCLWISNSCHFYVGGTRLAIQCVSISFLFCEQVTAYILKQGNCCSRELRWEFYSFKKIH